MMCWTSAFTSTMSPFLASFLSSLMRGLISAMWLSRSVRSAAAAADGDLDLLACGVKQAVVHLRYRRDILRRGETDARVRCGGFSEWRGSEGGPSVCRIVG